MNILLIGYGKMGKTIQRLAEGMGHKITGVIDINNPDDLAKHAKSSHVAIEFTRPESAYDNIKSCLELGLPVVSGTTGWLDQYDQICKLSKQQETGFFYASNYSIGVNIFFAINRKLAALMAPYQDYDVQVDETHHIHKLDKPSGTAITAAEGLIDNIPTIKDWVLEKDEDQKVKIVSHREGEVYGKHTIHYNSPIDEIILTHNAHTRDGFAVGAIKAAEWIMDKKGPHVMNDMLGL
jgi:4-hydroxy-tetrahydrodipicolinate reductase